MSHHLCDGAAMIFVNEAENHDREVLESPCSK